MGWIPRPTLVDCRYSTLSPPPCNYNYAPLPKKIEHIITMMPGLSLLLYWLIAQVFVRPPDIILSNNHSWGRSGKKSRPDEEYCHVVLIVISHLLLLLLLPPPSRRDPSRPHCRQSLHPFFSVVTIDNHASLDSRSLPESSLATSTAAHRQPRPPGQALCAVRPQQLQPPSSLTLPGPDAMDVSRSNEQNTTPPPPQPPRTHRVTSVAWWLSVCVYN